MPVSRRSTGTCEPGGDRLGSHGRPCRDMSGRKPAEGRRRPASCARTTSSTRCSPPPSSFLRAVQRALISEGNESKTQRRAVLSASLERTGRRLLELALNDAEANPDQAVRAVQAFVKVTARLAKLWDLDAPQRRVVEHHVITDEVLTAEREMLWAELVEMGVDPDLLPSVEALVEVIKAQAIALEASATVVDLAPPAVEQ